MWTCLKKPSWIFEFGAVQASPHHWIPSLLNLSKQENQKKGNSGRIRQKRISSLELVHLFPHLLSTHMLWQSRMPCLPSFLYFPQTSLRCCGLLVSSPGLCFSPGWRLPEALFTVSRLESKAAKACKSCRSRQELSNEYLVFTCKIRLRYSRERASQRLPKDSSSQKLE